MATAIAQHPAKIVAHVDGLAASSASFIILAADEIEISAGAFIMVHNPWSMTVGDAADHEATAELLKKYGEAMADDYAKRTKKDRKTVKRWMEDETWFSAEEAVEAGLADRVVDIVAPKNQWNLSAYRNPPADLWQGGAVAAMAQTRPNEVQGSAPDDSNEQETSMVNTTQNVEPSGQNPSPSPNAEHTQAAVSAERSRVAEINRLGVRAQMSPETITAAIERGTSVDDFRTVIVDALCERQMAESPDTRVGAVSASVVRDETETRRTLMQASILNRVNPNTYKVESQNEFRMMSLPRLAEESLVRAGLSIRGKSPSEIAVMALHSTSDFPYILENSLRKVLLDEYEAVNPTYKLWTKRHIATDFKTMRRIRRGEAPSLLQVPEGAEITMGTMGEERESYAIATYGRGISFTRQMLINDDLSAFQDIAGAFGEQAARLENKIVYAILKTNGNMADGNPLFDALHSNSGTGAIGNTGLDSMFVAMRTQKGVDGVTVVGLEPRFLIVPPAKEATARSTQMAIGPNVKAADQNWFAGMLTVVSDAELTDTAKWYGAAGRAGIEYAHLAGAEGPQFIREENAGGILGVKMYAFIDFGATAVDWRGLYYSTGV
jgi:enoyl-CoA hydratase/carnithine racemase